MNFDPQKYHRSSIRLKKYDYTRPGGYFVTIVTYQRDCIFGEIANEEIQLNEFGHIADECWRAIPNHFPNVDLGTYVVMPNHVHGIIVMNNRADAAASARRGTKHLPRLQVLGIVPLRNNLENPLLVQFPQSFEHSNPPSRAALVAN